ncbi:hypothetical protein [Planktothrix agardhii]|uniref:Uncharacterized protein n=1 Tax=Planktothrix rubescens CCAP 1459/22 TaxID=329571 RepID=A0A6J7ZLC6_PLARU|nr:hypothetical protein [Planktothrix agardhii]CAC5343198.1 hypothetical protein PLAN_30427 [Planktothrix rubescens NIVA-CYA 18]CAD0233004.1 conserved hypothetical protein [Planktothrix agardhii]
MATQTKPTFVGLRKNQRTKQLEIVATQTKPTFVGLRPEFSLSPRRWT